MFITGARRVVVLGRTCGHLPKAQGQSRTHYAIAESMNISSIWRVPSISAVERKLQMWIHIEDDGEIVSDDIDVLHDRLKKYQSVKYNEDVIDELFESWYKLSLATICIDFPEGLEYKYGGTEPAKGVT